MRMEERQVYSGADFWMPVLGHPCLVLATPSNFTHLHSNLVILGGERHPHQNGLRQSGLYEVGWSPCPSAALDLEGDGGSSGQEARKELIKVQAPALPKDSSLFPHPTMIQRPSMSC